LKVDRIIIVKYTLRRRQRVYGRQPKCTVYYIYQNSLGIYLRWCLQFY